MPNTDLVAHIAVALAIYALLYGAAAMTMIGFAMMLGGPAAAQTAAEFFIAAPLRWLFGQAAMLITMVLAMIGGVVTEFARAVVRHIIDPLLRPIAYLIRFLLAGPPA